MKICNAVTSDVKEIYNLIEIYAKEGVVLPRSLLSLSIFTMFICYERRGEIIGVAGLHVLERTLQKYDR